MSILAVSAAMHILEILADSPDSISVSELTDHFEMNKGSVSRLLGTLEQEGYLSQLPSTGRYVLTLKLLSLANRYTDRLGFPGAVQPLIDRLAAEQGELVQLAASSGERLYVIAKADGDKRIRVESLLGKVIALHASAQGKAWLSALPENEALRILASQELPRLTERTVTDLFSLQQELERARANGYALQDQELMEHMAAIAVPVRHRVTGYAVGSLAIAAPAFRFPLERRLGLLGTLQATAERMAAVWPDDFTYLRPFDRTDTHPSLLGI
jgi:IclR family transcriptional regulator, acetate operon repressor